MTLTTDLTTVDGHKEVEFEPPTCEADKQSKKTCVYKPAEVTDREIQSKKSRQRTDDFFKVFSKPEKNLTQKFKDFVCYSFEPVDLGYSVTKLTLFRWEKTFFHRKYFFEVFKSITEAVDFPPQEFKRPSVIDLSQVSFSTIDSIMRKVQVTPKTIPISANGLDVNQVHKSEEVEVSASHGQLVHKEANSLTPSMRFPLDRLGNHGSSMFWEIHSTGIASKSSRSSRSEGVPKRFEKYCNLKNKANATNFERHPPGYPNPCHLRAPRTHPPRHGVIPTNPAVPPSVVNYNRCHDASRTQFPPPVYDHQKQVEMNHCLQNQGNMLHGQSPLRPLPIVLDTSPYGRVHQTDPYVVQAGHGVAPNALLLPHVAGSFHNRLNSEVAALSNMYPINPILCTNPGFMVHPGTSMENLCIHPALRNPFRPVYGESQTNVFVGHQYNGNCAMSKTFASPASVPGGKKLKKTKVPPRQSDYQQFNNADAEYSHSGVNS